MGNVFGREKEDLTGVVIDYKVNFSLPVSLATLCVGHRE